MKKGVPFEWDEACQNAFDGIKAYPLNLPVLIERTKAHPVYHSFGRLSITPEQ